MGSGASGVFRWGLGIAAALAVTGATAADVVLKLSEPDGGPAGDVVVALASRTEPGAAALPLVSHRNSKPVVIDQRDKAFVPAITVVQAGTEITFPNNDSTSHHVYSFSKPNAFELPLYKGDLHRPVKFDSAGIATLGCNIHDFMVGYVVVVDTPWFGQTAADGSLTLAGLPSGPYAVTVWSPRLDRGHFQDLGTVNVAAGAETALVLPRALRGTPFRARSSLVREGY